MTTIVRSLGASTASKLCHFDFAFISLHMAALETGNAPIVACIICRTNFHSILACLYLPGAQEFIRNASYAPRASHRSRRHSKRSTSSKHTSAPSIIPESAGNASSSTPIPLSNSMQASVWIQTLVLQPIWRRIGTGYASMSPSVAERSVRTQYGRR